MIHPLQVYTPGQVEQVSSLTLNVTGYTSVGVNITTATVWVANSALVEGNFNSFPERKLICMTVDDLRRKQNNA